MVVVVVVVQRIVSLDAHRLSDVMVLSYVHGLIYFLHLNYIR